MSNNPANTPPPTGQVPPNGDLPGQAPNSNGQVPNDQPPNQNQQQPSAEELLRQIADLRKENAAHRKKNKDAEDAASLLEQQRLVQRGEFEELAKKHEARVKELEPISTSYKALSERVNAQIDTQIKDWPAEVKSLVPSSETAVEQRLEQLEKLRPLVDKLQLQAKGNQPGNAPNPRPTGQVGDPSSKEETIKKLRSSGMYGF